MKILLLKPYYIVLIPALIALALVLFLLDQLNVDVKPVTSYTPKEG